MSLNIKKMTQESPWTVCNPFAQRSARCAIFTSMDAGIAQRLRQCLRCPSHVLLCSLLCSETLVQKWVPFGPHFVFCENHGFCCRKWGPIGGHNEKICCLKSKEHLETSCTKMYVTLSKIENICSNVTKYESNWPSGSRDMAIYFHSLKQEFW